MILEGKIGEGAAVKSAPPRPGLTIDGQEFAASPTSLWMSHRRRGAELTRRQKRRVIPGERRSAARKGIHFSSPAVRVAVIGALRDEPDRPLRFPQSDSGQGPLCQPNLSQAASRP